MEIRPFAEEGGQRIVKGMFERGNLIGPNWMDVPGSVTNIDAQLEKQFSDEEVQNIQKLIKFD